MNKCWFHRWKVAKDTGITVYSECTKCGSRKAYQRPIGLYQPIDHRWLNNLEPVEPIPPRGGSPVRRLNASR